MIIKRGQIIKMIICKKPDPPDDQLQEARSSRLSFASPDDHSTTKTITATGVKGGITRVTGVGTEGVEKGKEGEEILAHGTNGRSNQR